MKVKILPFKEHVMECQLKADKKDVLHNARNARRCQILYLLLSFNDYSCQSLFVIVSSSFATRMSLNFSHELGFCTTTNPHFS